MPVLHLMPGDPCGCHYIHRPCLPDIALVIPHKFARPREAGWLDECAPEILRCAQDDTTPGCHPERSEGSLVDFWGITRYGSSLGVWKSCRQTDVKEGAGPIRSVDYLRTIHMPGSSFTNRLSRLFLVEWLMLGFAL